ncbi:hypothetical protein DUNSADRAFT_5341 [Dunaliella salina]|uniref:Encoded protein n=1 Tax=Dunaliella salina TaxID=3046 RepID=A0ABQ7GQG3_DUNSA|nr:hypothetical protein DUNSADRAFT_5341 [Dunaliella salina]|eukprot:KAF5836850.1 hypothetical protein DUNSADRAFT_5341 [Dunaliella salina]
MTAVFAEFDLIKTWNKQMAETAILKRHSMTGMLCLLSCWLPWPFSNVDLIVDAVGLNFLREKQRCLFLTFQSPLSLPDDVQLSPSHRSNKRLRMLPGSYFHYQPLPPNAPGKPPRVRCCIEALIEPDMHMPSFLVSFVLQVLAPFFFSTVSGLLKRAFKNQADPLPQRMIQKPKLYDIISSSAREAMANQEDSPAGHA